MDTGRRPPVGGRSYVREELAFVHTDCVVSRHRGVGQGRHGLGGLPVTVMGHQLRLAKLIAPIVFEFQVENVRRGSAAAQKFGCFAGEHGPHNNVDRHSSEYRGRSLYTQLVGT